MHLFVLFFFLPTEAKVFNPRTLQGPRSFQVTGIYFIEKVT